MTARVLYGRLMGLAKLGDAHPSQQYLADQLGVSDRTIRRCLVELREAGVLSTNKRGWGKGLAYRLQNVSVPASIRTFLSYPIRTDLAGLCISKEPSKNRTAEPCEGDGVVDNVGDQFKILPLPVSGIDRVIYHWKRGTIERTGNRPVTRIKGYRTVAKALIDDVGQEQAEMIAYEWGARPPDYWFSSGKLGIVLIRYAANDILVDQDRRKRWGVG